LGYLQAVECSESKELLEIAFKGKAKRCSEKIYFFVDWAISCGADSEEVSVWVLFSGFFSKTPLSTNWDSRVCFPVKVFVKFENLFECGLEKLLAVEDGQKFRLN
jgi:hypothetical protein